MAIGSITRRDMLGVMAKGGAVLGAGVLIDACGSSSTAKTTTTGPTGKPKAGGTLTVGLTGGSSSDTLDPNKLVNNTDYARACSLFEGLAWQNASAQPYMRLAEEMTPSKDAKTWTIRLRDGVRFHDGRPATADDLAFSIKRAVNPKSPGIASNVLAGVQTNALRKRDSRTLEVPFDRPYATLYGALAEQTTLMLVPTDFDPTRPIGTGPFKFTSFNPGQRSVFTRFEDYWDHPRPYLDKLVLVDYADDSSQLNALISGQVDCVNLLAQNVIGQVTSGGKQVVISDGGGWNPFTMRVDQAPFNDVRVRQAFRLMVDRPKMLEIVFGGHGTIGNDVFGIWDQEYNHGLAQRQQDIEQAKSLLKSAGHEGLHVQLVTSGIAQGITSMAQVFAQQAAQAGVNVNLRTVTSTEFYGSNYLKWLFAQDYWYFGPYLGQVGLATLPAAPYNETHFDNPRYNHLYDQALATLDSSRRTEIAHEMQQIDYEQGGYIIPFFPPVIDGYARNVGGAVKSKCGTSFNGWDFESLWLT